ncbi:MAG: hypothetical protein K6F61_03895 [Clostridiales bacterium]|nr:hypothetical protein [Clostridiales bacterium]
MGLFGKKTRVSDFYSAQEIQVLQAVVAPQIITRLMDFNARTLYESFIRVAGDSGRKLDRDGVSRLLAAAEGFAKADPTSGAALQNGIRKMKAWLEDPSNH